MINHRFKIVPYAMMGPVRNREGYIFSVAQIDDSWVIRWTDPEDGQDHYRYCSDYGAVLRTIRSFYKHV